MDQNIFSIIINGLFDKFFKVFLRENIQFVQELSKDFPRRLEASFCIRVIFDSIRTLQQRAVSKVVQYKCKTCFFFAEFQRFFFLELTS